VRDNCLAKVAGEGNGNIGRIRHGDSGWGGDRGLHAAKREKKTKQ